MGVVIVKPVISAGLDVGVELEAGTEGLAFDVDVLGTDPGAATDPDRQRLGLALSHHVGHAGVTLPEGDFVEIYTGIKPEIVEEYGAGWRIGVRSTVEVDTKVYGTWEENAHRFSVLVATFEEFDPERKAKVRERVLIEKPAHTQLVHVGWFASFWQIGVRSTLGVDAKVGG